MARNLQICREHDLNHEECVNLAEELLDKLVGHFGGSVSCVGDDYQYTHPTGIKAMVVPGEQDLMVNVKLGLLTRSLAPRLEEEINRVLDEYIGASKAS